MPTVAATESVRSLIAAELPSLVSIRHDLHRHPELGFQEKRTSEVVQRELTRLGIEFKAGYAMGTGVIAHLPATDAADASKPAVALRADMDALPIEEETGRTYSSVHKGVMHACGHDGHTTILLGAARVLSKLNRPNPVTLVFQPAEEGGGGGEKMCEEGVLLGDSGGGFGPKVARMYGLHGWPSIPLGIIGTRPGPLLAAVDDFVVHVKGIGGHAAYPHLAADPILAMSHTITALQSITSRNVGPLDSAVCTVGAVQAGTADNIIPQVARFIGTVRTLQASTRRMVRERFHSIIENTTRAFGCTAEIEYIESYPVTTNDAELAEKFLDLARATVGGDQVQRIENPTMGGEDFAYYAQHVPACFFLLGLKPAGAGRVANLHQPDFDFNDDAIATGVEMMVAAARSS